MSTNEIDYTKTQEFKDGVIDENGYFIRKALASSAIVGKVVQLFDSKIPSQYKEFGVVIKSINTDLFEVKPFKRNIDTGENTKQTTGLTVYHFREMKLMNPTHLTGTVKKYKILYRDAIYGFCVSEDYYRDCAEFDSKVCVAALRCIPESEKEFNE